ncbi:MAG: DUF3576 domain-containing protein [Rhodobacteraceae bacterium]|nr:DUF3576 domain-containing protein [Paracoccaceae bacterium]
MRLGKGAALGIVALSLGLVAGCGDRGPSGAGDETSQVVNREVRSVVESRTSIWDVFNRQGEENTVKVNRYIWAASLDVLDFLPIQSIDPFTGVIVTGYGTPPGGGRAYRATVLIDDPALDARALSVAMQTRSGPVAESTVRAVEDAILNRARQLRIADNKL